MGGRPLYGDRDQRDAFGWWGYQSSSPVERPITELIERGVLDARIAAFLWLALERRASLVVAATPSHAGKTTTLTALLDFLPADVTCLYLRGWYERFAFVRQNDPATTYLLCNEISSHLPIYLWGRGVRKLFEAMQLGFGMATTVHAAGADEVISLLTSFPLDVPRELISGIDLVLTLGIGQGRNGLIRRLMRVELIHDRDGVPVPETIAERDVLLGSLSARPGRLIAMLVDHFGFDNHCATAELARRERVLAGLVRDGVRSPAEVRAAVQQAVHESS